MKETKDIKEFLTNLKFKKTLFGVREDQAYEAMQKLDKMYEKRVEEVKNEFEKAEGDHMREASRLSTMIGDIFDMRASLIDNARRQADEILEGAQEAERKGREKAAEECEKILRVRSDSISELSAMKDAIRGLCDRADSLRAQLEEMLAALEALEDECLGGFAWPEMPKDESAEDEIKESEAATAGV